MLPSPKGLRGTFALPRHGIKHQQIQSPTEPTRTDVKQSDFSEDCVPKSATGAPTSALVHDAFLRQYSEITRSWETLLFSFSVTKREGCKGPNTRSTTSHSSSARLYLSAWGAVHFSTLSMMFK
ncbi:hypothetical protein CHARACLAT_019682 [Characodon lateralis]|uniref:Uncharacterized protein n=1 Tax=Characodon lateralis TaxID=208331 RepID=A0ABU7EB43_9TELE|nr:hypothetical protein [Characodon lateralis]